MDVSSRVSRAGQGVRNSQNSFAGAGTAEQTWSENQPRPLSGGASAQPVNVTLSGLSTAVPTHSISQDHATDLSFDIGVTEKYVKSLETLYRRSGVQRRYSVVLDSTSQGSEASVQNFYGKSSDGGQFNPTTEERMQRYEQEADGLAIHAARKALQQAQVKVEDITHVVTVSCSGFAAPGVDLALIEQLGLPRGVERAHVGFMGCHGALNGLRVAKGWAAADPSACVLLCAVELCSLHYQYTDNAQQLVANALFSDGAAAMIVRQQPAPTTAGCRVVSQAAYIIPDTADMMSWRIANHGFQMSLSPKVPEIILKVLRPWMTEWLAKYQLKVEDIQNWAVHPGGPRILAATAECLELTPEQIGHSEAILASHGNMSSPTVMFILERIQSQARRGPTVMLGFGPGLAIEAALLDW